MSWLLDTTVKMSLVLAIGLLAARALRRGSAALRHWVIAAAVFCAAGVPMFSVVAPTWTLPAEPRGPALGTQIAVTVDGASHGAVLPHAIPTLPRVRVLNTLSSFILPLWLLGGVVNLVVILVSMWRLARLAARAAVVRPGTWTDLLVSISQSLGVKRRVALLQSDRPALLVTWGGVSPKVLLPRDAANWSEERVRVVLAHELAHIARADWVVQMIAELLRCVYWFNPLVWIACLRLRHESEYACDDAVIGAGVESDVYATHLLELARLFGKYRRTWFPVPAIAGRSSTLERRISAMLNSRLNRAPLTRTGRWGWTIALLTIALPIAAFAQSSFGSVTGTVVDQMDRVLPNVTITLTDAQRNAKHEVRTDRDGRFDVVGLPPGTYDLAAKVPGFQPQSADVVVNGDALERNLKLEVGELLETITVTGDPDANEADRTAGSSVSRRPIPACPQTSIGGNIRAPRQVRRVRPAYPGVDGTVSLAARIATDGSVREVRVVRADRPELEGPAIAAVSQWQFDETLLDCAPVEVTMNVIVNFRQKQ